MSISNTIHFLFSKFMSWCLGNCVLNMSYSSLDNNGHVLASCALPHTLCHVVPVLKLTPRYSHRVYSLCQLCVQQCSSWSLWQTSVWASVSWSSFIHMHTHTCMLAQGYAWMPFVSRRSLCNSVESQEVECTIDLSSVVWPLLLVCMFTRVKNFSVKSLCM